MSILDGPVDPGTDSGADEVCLPPLQAPDEFRVETLSSDGVHRIVLQGEFDVAAAPLVREQVLAACAKPTREVRLDLRRLTFIDSSGLYVLLSTRELCMHSGYEFALVGRPPAVQRLFEVSGVSGLLAAAQRP